MYDRSFGRGPHLGAMLAAAHTRNGREGGERPEEWQQQQKQLQEQQQRLHLYQPGGHAGGVHGYSNLGLQSKILGVSARLFVFAYVSVCIT